MGERSSVAGCTMGGRLARDVDLLFVHVGTAGWLLVRCFR